MNGSYFARVRAAAHGHFWVNNPTLEELDRAIAAGAMGCTTNPGYGGNLARRAPEEIRPVVRDVVRSEADDARSAELTQHRLVSRIAERLLPLFESSNGRAGFVSLQGSPETDGDAAEIEREAREARALAPNVAPKIPATKPGLQAMERLVTDNHPVIVTEVFSIAQLKETAERWLKAAEASGVRPPFFISPITGIFGDYLKQIAVRDGLAVPDAETEQVGIVLGRRCFGLVRAQEYPVVLLYGGARTRLDFTGLVGGGMAATINWSTAADLLESPPPVRATITDPPGPALERRLSDAFPDVRRALAADGLTLDEFEDFGPVQHFRATFLTGWRAVRSLVEEARTIGRPVAGGRAGGGTPS